RGVGVGERSVVADELADLAVLQDPDEQRRPEDGDGERDTGGDEERDHGDRLGSSRAAATCSSPTARLAFTRTASPGRASPATAAAAVHGSAASTTVTPPARAA